jgi:hypothetical protein
VGLALAVSIVFEKRIVKRETDIFLVPSMIRNAPQDAPADGDRAIGEEPDASIWVNRLDGPHEAEGASLNKIHEGKPGSEAPEFESRLDNKAQICFNELVLRILVAGSCARHERALLVLR